MPIGIKTLNLVSEASGVSLLDEVKIEGKNHKLLKVKLGHAAHMEIEVFLRSWRAKDEIKQKVKWIWAIQDEHTKEWQLRGWTDDDNLPMEILGKKTTEYANSPTVLITSDNSNIAGKLYWLEAFIYYPEMPEASIPKGVYVTFEDSPVLKKTCFTDKGTCTFSKKELAYIPITQYGQTIDLFLETYKLPDPNLPYHNYGVFKVTVFSKKTGDAVQEEIVFEQETEGDKAFLGVTRISLLVSEEWRAKIGHQPKEVEEFYAEVTPVLFYNENATLASKGQPQRPYSVISRREGFTETSAPNDESVLISHYRPPRLTLLSSISTSRIYNENKEYEQTVLPVEKTMNTFKVLYNTGQEILIARQKKVGQQMASILDTKHKCIPNDYGCKYTGITLTEKDKNPYDVLKENDAGEVIDHTQRIFGIIAGDKKKKEVTITLEDLTHAGSDKPVECLEIGGNKHESPESVFLMDDKVLASQSISKDDFTIDGNKLTLFAKYNYNRSYESKAQKWLGIAANTISSAANPRVSNNDIAWVTRYFKMKNEHAQPHFIPVQTCRYPNQVVRLNVYPDFEWWVNLKFNAENPVYVRQPPNYGYRIFTTRKNQNQKKAGALRSDKAKAKKWEYDFEFEAGFSQNGVKEDLKLGDGFPAINAVNFLLKAYELFKALTFADETEDKESSIAAGKAKTSSGGVAKTMSKRYALRKSKGFPFRIDVKRPSLSLGFHGKYEYSKTKKGSVGEYYTANLAASPLFGVTGKVDLLYFAQFIGPIGQAMHRINQVVKRVNYLTLGAVHIDYYLYIAAEVDFNLNVDALEYHSIDGWGGGDVSSKIDIKIWLEAGVNVEVNIQGVGGGEAAGVVRGEAKMYVNILHDKRSNKAEGWFKFNGLDAKIWLKLKVESKKKGGSSKNPKNQEEPKEKPTAIKKILDAAEPWKINFLK